MQTRSGEIKAGPSFGKVPLFAMCFILAPSLRRAAAVLSCAGQEPSARIRSSGAPCRRSLSPAIRSAPTMVRMRCAMMRTACFVQSGRGCGRNSGFIFRVQADSGFLRQDGKCALPGFVDSKNEEKTERNAGYLVVSHSGGGMLRQGTRKGIRRTPANRGMRAHRVVKGLDISEDVCHGMCP